MGVDLTPCSSQPARKKPVLDVQSGWKWGCCVFVDTGGQDPS